MRTENRIKSFKCEVDHCGKAFAKSNNLKQHYRVHSGEKPFKCGLCNQEFKQHGHLYKHFRTHSNQKPFECPIEGCDTRFTAKASMQRHAWKIHGQGNGDIQRRISSSNLAVSSIQEDDEGDVEAAADVLLRCGVCPSGNATGEGDEDKDNNNNNSSSSSNNNNNNNNNSSNSNNNNNGSEAETERQKNLEDIGDLFQAAAKLYQSSPQGMMMGIIGVPWIPIPIPGSPPPQQQQQQQQQQQLHIIHPHQSLDAPLLPAGHPNLSPLPSCYYTYPFPSPHYIQPLPLPLPVFDAATMTPQPDACTGVEQRGVVP